MKKHKIYLLTLSFTVLMHTVALGQSSGKQEYTVPLSDPGKPGKLFAKLHKGSIKVEGYSGKDVIVTVIPGDNNEESRSSSSSSLRRIPNTATEFEIVEEGNEVRIQGVNNKHVNFVVKVPSKFSLQLNTHHDGYIEVSNVTGEIVADGHHEDVVLKNIGGSAIVDTHHGEIKVSFNSITANAPMAFSTYHGDIEIEFPSTIDSSVKIKTTKGEIYTDFDLDLRVESSVVKSGGSGTKIQVGGWLRGDLGSGGPEFLFSTYHGDVILREK
ncbi:MAG: hypothetical protein ABJP45_01650 [Cyclobacteriaceae bacterium]